MSFVHRHRVRYFECDMQGHVFNANYLTWFDIAHTELLRDALGPYDEVVDAHRVEFVVAEANVRFRASARFDDDIEIEVTLEPPGESSLNSAFHVRRDNTVLAEGRLRHVCVDATTFKKTPWPPALRAAWEKHADTVQS